LLYLGLAKNIRSGGIANYNLQKINVRNINLPDFSQTELIELETSPQKDPTGDVMHMLIDFHLENHDVPFFYFKPYGLPYILAGFHALLGYSPEEHWYLVNTKRSAIQSILHWPFQLAKYQWQWLVPTLLSSLTLIYLTFFLGRKLFDEPTGLLGAFVIALYPIDILIANRIFADDFNDVFTILGLLAAWKSIEKKSNMWAVIAGCSWGVAYLMKQTFMGMGFCLILIESARWISRRSKKSQGIGFFSKFQFILCGLAFLVSIAHFIAWDTGFQDKLFAIHSGAKENTNSPWVQFHLSRPQPLLFYSIGILTLCPIIICSIFSWRDKRIQWLGLLGISYYLIISILLLREFRFMHPVMPFLILAGSNGFLRIYKRWKLILPMYILFQLYASLWLSYHFAWEGGGAEVVFPF
jgi:4-amino-4-deoxy-L-arabinose transferase-like glycosyltransferase